MAREAWRIRWREIRSDEQFVIEDWIGDPLDTGLRRGVRLVWRAVRRGLYPRMTGSQFAPGMAHLRAGVHRVDGVPTHAILPGWRCARRCSRRGGAR